MNYIDTQEESGCRQFITTKLTQYPPVYGENGRIVTGEAFRTLLRLRDKNNPKNVLRVGPGTPYCHFCAHDNTETKPTQKGAVIGVFCAEQECGRYLYWL